MSEDAVGRLRAELGGRELPGSAEALSEEQLACLADMVADLRTRQEREYHRAVEEALSHIPRMLRGSVRRILG